MDEIDVRIVRVEPQRVAASYGFGSGPEDIAWKKMDSFVQEKKLMEDGAVHRFFGFNNPSPTPGSPNYGYEQWVTIGPDVTPSGDIQIKDFEGGLYAVTRCQLQNITEVWHKLAIWREKSPYRAGSHQWLEECLKPPINGQGIEITFELDLYIPILG